MNMGGCAYHISGDNCSSALHAHPRPPTCNPCPQVEASSAYRGIGIVKLAGRQSGFICVQV